jgi:hypothetical protein
VLPSYLGLIALIRPVSAGPAAPSGPAWRRWLSRGLPLPWALAPAALAALAFFGFVTWDFRHFARDRLAGFDSALAAIPPGQSVLAFPVRPDPHYTLPHPYLVQHYVARKGGRAVPHLRGHRGSYWITMKPPPESPPWGDPRVFDFFLHGDWDYFLIERPIDDFATGPVRPVLVPARATLEGDEETTPDRPHPMWTAPARAVRRVSNEGRFELWQRVR